MLTLMAHSRDRSKDGKQYIALITGRHPSYTFNREWVGQKIGKRHEATQADIDEPGLYELGHVKKTGKAPEYVLVLHVGQHLKQYPCSKQDAMKIGRALDKDIPFASIVKPNEDLSGVLILTPGLAKKETAKADKSRTVQEAEDACWAILQALPANIANKVIVALKKKLKPPPVEAEGEQPPTESQPQDGVATESSAG